MNYLLRSLKFLRAPPTEQHLIFGMLWRIKMKEWEKFQRIEVKQILKLRGWKVTDEIQIGSKRVDLYAEKEGEFSEVERIAVECKNYAERLTKEVVEKTVISYLPLLENRQVDRILIVTRNGLSPAAEAYKRQLRSVVHQTIYELLDSVIDFSSYVHGMDTQFALDGLDKLYVDQGFKMFGPSDPSGPKSYHSLLSHVLHWIETVGTQPLAILAGYGMGKSSFARKLCHVLAKKHLNNSSSRIPILLRLDEIAAEQTLDGLLGRHFTSLWTVPRYNFQTFIRLNAMGRFVICLDGFDEMKKTMSWESLRYNLQQLHQLCTKDSKVLLLGRPTAFLDEAEQEEGLHGRIYLGGRKHQVQGWPDFKEIYLEPFTESELGEYFRRYLKTTTLTEDARRRLTRALEGLTSGPDRQLIDMARRPVQANMLIAVLPGFTGPLDTMTTCVLYSEFINYSIRRELGKMSRHDTFSLHKRRQFCRQLAVWMWTQRMGLQTTLSSIPDEVFRGLIPTDNHDDGLRRDLLSGSVLEKKPPEGFYFPHRSFQEFLVAEYLAEMAEKLHPDFLQFPYATPEVGKFFVELFALKHYKEFRKWIFSKKGSVSKNITDLLARLAEHVGDPLSRVEIQLLIAGKVVEEKPIMPVAKINIEPVKLKNKKIKKRNYRKNSGIIHKKW